MVRKRKELPDVGELVIGTVIKVIDPGAYVKLDEYGDKIAFAPAVEITRSVFRPIREIVKVGRKYVFKVIKVDRRKQLINVSLLKVYPAERRNKLIEWKRAQRAEKLLELAAKRIGKTLDEAYDEAGWKLEDYYGEIYAGLEEAALKGEKALLKAGVDSEWAKVLAELAKTYIPIKKVKIKGVLTLVCFKKDGIKAIKTALIRAAEYIKKHEKDLTSWRIYTLGAPNYKIELETVNPKKGEKILREAARIALEEIKKFGGTGNFRREKG